MHPDDGDGDGGGEGGAPPGWLLLPRPPTLYPPHSMPSWSGNLQDTQATDHQVGKHHSPSPFPLRRSQCGFSGNLPLICCPEERREEREETTPFPGTARRGFTGEEERGRREEEQRGGREEEERGEEDEEFPVDSNFFPISEEFP